MWCVPGRCAKYSVMQGGMLASDKACIGPPGMASNPARGGPKREIDFPFPPFLLQDLIFARRVRASRPTPVRLPPPLMLNLVQIASCTGRPLWPAFVRTRILQASIGWEKRGGGGGSLGPWILGEAHPMAENFLEPAGSSTPIIVGAHFFLLFD